MAIYTEVEIELDRVADDELVDELEARGYTFIGKLAYQRNYDDLLEHLRIDCLVPENLITRLKDYRPWAPADFEKQKAWLAACPSKPVISPYIGIPAGGQAEVMDDFEFILHRYLRKRKHNESIYRWFPWMK
jgi:hypothetical protein